MSDFGENINPPLKEIPVDENITNVPIDELLKLKSGGKVLLDVNVSGENFRLSFIRDQIPPCTDGFKFQPFSIHEKMLGFIAWVELYGKDAIRFNVKNREKELLYKPIHPADFVKWSIFDLAPRISGEEVQFIYETWPSSSVNFAAYIQAKKDGSSMQGAAKLTWSGKLYEKLGFYPETISERLFTGGKEVFVTFSKGYEGAVTEKSAWK